MSEAGGGQHSSAVKWIAVVFVACVCLFAYHAHRQSVAAAEAAAREAALEEGRRASAAQLAREREAREKAEHDRQAALNAAARRPLMAVSRVVEPLLITVQAPLDAQKPADVVPIIELTKQRILDKRAQAEPERQPVFDRAAAVLDQLAVLAEERTSFLEAMLRNRASASTSLTRPNTGSSSTFFTQNTAKRWDETVKRLRPAVLQEMEQLRAAERKWNSQVDPRHETETYDVVHFKPLLIPAEQVAQNSLSPAAKSGSNTSSRIWRRPYYYTYGYRVPNSAYYPNYPSYP